MYVFSDSSHTVPVMYGAAPGPLQPLPKGHDKPENGTEMQVEISVSAFVQPIYFLTLLPVDSNCPLLLSRVCLHGIPDHPRGHQRPWAQRDEAGQGRHAVWLKVCLFYLLMLWCWPQIVEERLRALQYLGHLLLSIKQQKSYSQHILLATIRMSPVNWEQWHNVY